MMTLCSYPEPASNSVPSDRKVTTILAKMRPFSSLESYRAWYKLSRLSCGEYSTTHQDIVLTSEGETTTQIRIGMTT
jgi:hypothetical protein